MMLRERHRNILEVDSIGRGRSIEKRHPPHDSDLIEGGRHCENEIVSISAGVEVRIRRNAGQFPGDAMGIGWEQGDAK